ncbi:CDKN2AIP N-terminal-like protein, partial [Toxocara canis]
KIRRGTHRFDLSRCLESVPPLLAPRRSDEVWWLAKLLYRLSCFMNQTALIIHLSHTYYDCSFTGMVARRILDPAYPHTVVPAFSKTVFVMKPAINFRRFAQYKYVAPTKEYESDNEWRARRMFLERHCDDYRRARLLCLSQIFININFLGCKYSETLMAKVREMGAGICEQANNGCRKNFEKGYSKGSAGRRAGAGPPSKVRKTAVEAPDTAKAKNFMLLKAEISVMESRMDALQSLNQAASRVKVAWELKDVDKDGRIALNVDNVTVLRCTFPGGKNPVAKQCAAAATLAAISCNFMLLKAEISVMESRMDALQSLNQAASRVKVAWELKDVDKDGRIALNVDNVTVLRCTFPGGKNPVAKQCAAAATLAAISCENIEIRNVAGNLELWRGKIGPAECYGDYVTSALHKAAILLPEQGTAYARLEKALQSANIPLKFVAEQGTGWQERIALTVLNVELASAVLKKSECIKGREAQRKEELAAAIISMISSPTLKIVEAQKGFTIAV